MCGLFGFAKKQNSQNDRQIATTREILRNLAEASEIRGKDSTGLSIITPERRNTYRAVIPASKFVSNPSWAEISKSINRDTTIAIGHVRLATHGVISVRNTHPFDVGQVTGAHNGIIFNYNELSQTMNKDIQVDSEVIFAKLNTNKKTDAFEDIYGDFAVSWVKDSNKILHLAREDGRPLSIAYWKKAKTMFYASTDLILEQALRKAGLMIKIKKLPADIIHTYNTDLFNRKPEVVKDTFKSISQDYHYEYHSYNKYKPSCTGQSLYPTSGGTENGWYDYCEVCGDWSHLNSGRCKEHYTDLYGNHNSECHYCKVEYPEVDLLYDTLDGYDICKSCSRAILTCDFCTDDMSVVKYVKRGDSKLCESCAEMFDSYNDKE